MLSSQEATMTRDRCHGCRDQIWHSLGGDFCVSLGKENRRLQDFRRLPRMISQKISSGVFSGLPPSGCGFFAYSWKLPAYSGAFLLTVDNFSFFTYSWSFLAYSFSFFTYSWSFLAYSGRVRLIRAFRDCKQRSLTVSKKAPTVSKKASPLPQTFPRADISCL